MKQIHKKLLFFPFFAVFACLLVFSVLPENKIFAAELEVNYPTLPTGAKITPASELTGYLKYVFDFGIGIGFIAVLISLAAAGVLYFLSPAIPWALAKAKDRVSGAISGLLILVLFYLIITTINPYLAIFKMGKLEPVDLPEPETRRSGVTFYKSTKCSGQSETHVTNVPDLGEKFRNNVYSVGMEKDPENKIAYVSILYDIANFWGKCQYVNPNEKCSEVQNFASSASVHQFDFHPEGDGIYVVRKSFFQEPEGGYLKISNSQIKRSKIAILKLEQLRFTGESQDYNNIEKCTVPQDERDCLKYDKKGRCIKEECPRLSKENISSIRISGDYAVLLVYFAPGDPAYGPWTYCQEYASAEDVNKQGPQNIKWDAVRSRNQDPNWLVIIPIKR